MQSAIQCFWSLLFGWIFAAFWTDFGMAFGTPGVSGPTLRCRLSAPDALVRWNFSAARENQFALQDGLHAVALDDFDTPVVKYVQECLTN